MFLIASWKHPYALLFVSAASKRLRECSQQTCISQRWCLPYGIAAGPWSPANFDCIREKAWRALCFPSKLLLRLCFRAESPLHLLMQLPQSAFCTARGKDNFPVLGVKPQGLWDHFQCKCDLITIAYIKDHCTLQVILINSLICRRRERHISWIAARNLVFDIHLRRLRENPSTRRVCLARELTVAR